ncbi:hypothetical protein B0H12DRAFT_1107402 [Mycena haematopus]|nr:hypothetical protein B0H12DRAFT_1107402 [Mycena haematopus]
MYNGFYIEGDVGLTGSRNRRHSPPTRSVSITIARTDRLSGGACGCYDVKCSGLRTAVVRYETMGLGPEGGTYRKGEGKEGKRAQNTSFCVLVVFLPASEGGRQGRRLRARNVTNVTETTRRISARAHILAGDMESFTDHTQLDVAAAPSEEGVGSETMRCAPGILR